jgi:hypothetical protein
MKTVKKILINITKEIKIYVKILSIHLFKNADWIKPLNDLKKKEKKNTSRCHL